MPTKDVIPQNRDAFVVWLANFVLHLVSLAAKYGIDPAKVEALAADNDWAQYWVKARNTAKQQDKQLSDFVSDTLDGAPGDAAIDSPMWVLPPDAPRNVPPGIIKRIREVINTIKSQTSVFSQADGKLLDIFTAEENGKTEADFTAGLYNLRARANYGVEASFRKLGRDAVRIEVRHKGGDWLTGGFLTKSPGVFNINPLVVGDAEMVELRAIFIKDNQPYGNYSPIYTITVAP